MSMRASINNCGQLSKIVKTLLINFAGFEVSNKRFASSSTVRWHGVRANGLIFKSSLCRSKPIKT